MIGSRHTEGMGTHVVDDDIDTLDVDTTPEDVGSDEDTLLERLELLEPVDTACQYTLLTLCHSLQMIHLSHPGLHTAHLLSLPGLTQARIALGVGV